ncbi:pH-sensitive chloride channel 2-like [Schistocerca gregaria]|uniref:pH-sensitive chloride channel 2-like n=1 Tax=Schistocerca gregaria TaxID=7010 RepID=UPI00211E8DC2|nr:pH-sensitive chloride channel 2-like [Schistocerca gregaria]
MAARETPPLAATCCSLLALLLLAAATTASPAQLLEAVTAAAAARPDTTASSDQVRPTAAAATTNQSTHRPTDSPAPTSPPAAAETPRRQSAPVVHEGGPGSHNAIPTPGSDRVETSSSASTINTTTSYVMWTPPIQLQAVNTTSVALPSQAPPAESKDTCVPLPADLSHVELVRRLTDSCRYDRLMRPGNASRPLDVFVRAHVFLFQSAEGQTLQFQAQLLLQLRYMDVRLAYGMLMDPAVVPEVVGESEMLTRVWVPHLFFGNEQSSSIMGTDSSKDVLLSIYPDGNVVFSQRLKAVVYCWMKLEKFPFDQQRCSISLESWTYNTSQLILQWEREMPVTMNPSLHLTEYSLNDMWTNETEVTYTNPGFTHGPFHGNYSTVSITFELQREIGFYMMDYYVPSMLLVMISWVSFWLEANAVPGRTTLGTSTMLTFITLSSKTSSQLPKVSYIKASEIWFLGCTAFIFGSLVEFAFVNTIWRRRHDVELKKVNSKYILKSTLTPRTARRQLGLQQNDRKDGQPLGRSSSCPSGMDSQRSSIPSLNSAQTVSSLLDVPNPTGNGDGNCVISLPVPSSNQTSQSQPASFTTMTPKEISQWIDKRSRIVFPIAFLIFNLFYWSFVWIF